MPEARSRVPLSQIRKAIEDNLDDDEFCVVENLSEEVIGIPMFICAIPENNNFTDPSGILPMPAELLETYNELAAIFRKVVGEPGTESYQWLKGDSIFPWELHKVVVEGEEYYVGWVDPEGACCYYEGEVEEDLDTYKNLIIYPCALVDPTL